MSIKIRPVRWWRDDATRYQSRDERRHFNLSEIPRGDDPELDAFVEHWRDTIGFCMFDAIVPMEFEALGPTIDEWRVRLDHPPPPLNPWFGVFWRKGG